MKTLIIAEAGVNHNGSLAMAKQLVDAAKSVGADIIKFQTFTAENLVTKDAKQAEYQKNNTGVTESQYSMLKDLELSYENFKELNNYCKSVNIQFLSTAFDSGSLRFLVENCNMPFLKIPSGELTNLPFILEHAKTQKKIILSTGMSNLEEIKDAVRTVYFGYFSNEKPTIKSIRQFYNDSKNFESFRERLVVLHCTTEYPTPLDQINLNALKTIQSELNLKAGYSDHSADTFVGPLAVAAGAEIIEKHLTLDKSLPGPDHKASLDPFEFKELVSKIRQTEKILGSYCKEAQPCELKNIQVARKSLVANCAINEGFEFTKENLTIKRPGSGLPPKEIWDLLGQKAVRNYLEGELI